MRRRKFIQLTTLASLGVVFLNACTQQAKKWIMRMTGTHHVLGHRLWSKDFPKVNETRTVRTLIVGGGVTGLSAARALARAGEKDFLVLELEGQLGGNSASGENEHSKYPLGAHYLPGINLHDTDLRIFLEEEGLITGYDEGGYPIYHPEYLCHAPESRLFQSFEWKEGLEPLVNVPQSVHDEFQRFYATMKIFREAKGSDDKFAFDLPLAFSSSDATYTQLDNRTMAKWLKENDFQTTQLLWYVNYCCLDDFGKGIEEVSAWAGIHYFTSRKYVLYNPNHHLLTWPEGNAFLVERLRTSISEKCMTNQCVYEVKPKDNRVEVLVYDALKDTSVLYFAERVIMAVPQYIAKYLVHRELDYATFDYAPWILATLKIERFPVGKGAELSWENILYQGKGLGYVYAQHQHLGSYSTPFVITYYRALEGDSKKMRKQLLNASDHFWEEEIVRDLELAHPEIRAYIQSIEIHKRGHGMIAPRVGFLTDSNRLNAQQTVDGKIYFAHSDLSGISLFEEAFYQGNKVAKAILHG